MNDGCRTSMIGLTYVRWTYIRISPADAGIPVTWWVIESREFLDLRTYIGPSTHFARLIRTIPICYMLLLLADATVERWRAFQ